MLLCGYTSADTSWLAERTYSCYNVETCSQPCLYQCLLESAQDIILVLADDGSLIEVNPAAEAAYGYTREELLQMNIRQLRAPETLQDVDRQFSTALTSGITFETIHRRKDGTTFPVEVNSSSFDLGNRRLVFSLVHNISKWHLQKAGNELLRIIDRLIIEGQPTKVVLQRICDGVVNSLGFACAYITLREPDGTLRITANDGLPEAVIPQLHMGWDELNDDVSPTWTAIRTRKISIAETSTAKPGQLLTLFREMGIKRLGSIPLVSHGETLGALTVGCRQYQPHFEEYIGQFARFGKQIAASFLAAQRHERLRLHTHICNSMPNPVFVLDAKGLIIWLNAAFSAVTGYTLDEAYGKPAQDLLNESSCTPEQLEDIWSNIKAGRTWHGEIANRKRDGSIYIADETITPVHADDGSILYFVAIQQDITERKRHEEQLYHLAMHDPLTGLLNRRALQSCLDAVIAQAKDGLIGHILSIDVDDFKLVNDTLGHSVGDELLVNLAHHLRSALRLTDVLARLGGDEFAIVLGQTNLTEAMSIAERIRREISSIEVRGKGLLFSPTVSIGVAAIDGQTQADEILATVDSALYDAKGRGKNRVIVHTGTNELPLLSQTGKWVTRLKEALRNDGFVLHFQPIVSLQHRSIAQYEALIRLIDGPRLLSPGVFLPIAEQFGLAADIDCWVIGKVLDTISSRPLPVAINLSGYTLNDPVKLSWIRDAVAQAKIAPGQLTFELTESMGLDNFEQLHGWMREMKQLGCSFSLDDFGKGFSSFSYLQSVYTNYVKLDASFTRGLANNEANRAIIKALVTVVKSLGRKVVVEGVEDRILLDQISDLDIDYVQGYYFGKPAPLEQSIEQATFLHF